MIKCILGTLLLVSSALCQTFEAAVIKPGGELTLQTKWGRQKGGVRLEYDCAPLITLFLHAYNIDLKDYELGVSSKDADWIKFTKWSVYAKADHPTTPAEMRIMLQPFIAEEFKVQVEKVKRKGEIGVVTLAPGGLKIKPEPPSDEPNGRFQIYRDLNHNTSFKVTLTDMHDICAYLNGHFGFPVVDQTGVPKDARYTFDIHTDTQYDASELSNPEKGNLLLKALGLKLQRKQGEYELLRLVHAEKPSLN